jgi:hypothetical protein
MAAVPLTPRRGERVIRRSSARGRSRYSGPVSFGTSALIMLLAALGRLLWRGLRFAPVPCRRISHVEHRRHVDRCT